MQSVPERLLIGRQGLAGDLLRLDNASGLVVFAHGSGSSRLSHRNRQVALAPQMRGLSTLLFDLMTADEAADLRHVFDIGLLSRRLLDAMQAVRELDPVMPIGLFGASTGAAAALAVAAQRPVEVQAVVSRGGRPDLAADLLAEVRAPTLLIVGGADSEVLTLNRNALEQPGCQKRRLEIVPRATHLFEEAGAMEEVARLAGDWFVAAFGAAPGGPAGSAARSPGEGQVSMFHSRSRKEIP